MKKVSFLKRLIAVLALIILPVAVYLLWARPYQLHWGATDEEISRSMPGDELDPDPTFLATRAIIIQGTPDEIWPWLLQMGYGRAGFYGYDILENLGSPRGIDSADRILSEFQHFVVGDKVPIYPVAGAEDIFYAIEPGQYLIWAGQTGQHPGGFIWALYPVDENHTRLVSRIRWGHHSITQPMMFFLDIFTDFTDHLAVRKILQGVKGRVEGNIEPAFLTNLEFASYVLAALIFFTAFTLTLIRPLNWIHWLAGLAAGVGWLLIWYAPIPWWGGILLEILILTIFYQTFFLKRLV
jgi:hypothetical protein